MLIVGSSFLRRTRESHTVVSRPSSRTPIPMSKCPTRVPLEDFKVAVSPIGVPDVVA